MQEPFAFNAGILLKCKRLILNSLKAEKIKTFRAFKLSDIVFTILCAFKLSVIVYTILCAFKLSDIIFTFLCAFQLSDIVFTI